MILISFLPLYLRTYYDKEPLFENSKIVTSLYGQGFDGNLSSEVINKLKFDGIKEEHVEELKEPDYVNMMKVAINNSDALIIGSDKLPEALDEYLKELEMPVLNYHKKEVFSEAYLDFCLSKVLQ